jgi:PAS domain-containing protein
VISSEQEVQLWTILEHLPIQVAWLNPRLQCKYANQPFSNETGLPPEALKGVRVLDSLRNAMP